MPLYTNIGGKLIEIKSLNTTTGDILKPIYGTPKENMKFHWGGFTGENNLSSMLIGTITLNCPTYVSVLLEIPDNTASTLFVTPNDQMIVDGFYEDINTDNYDYKVEYYEHSSVSFGDNSGSITNGKSYLRTPDGWALEHDYVKNTKLTSQYLMNNNTNTNEYKVEVLRYSFYIAFRRAKNTNNDWSWKIKNTFPMDGMTADFTFSFQSLQQT